MRRMICVVGVVAVILVFASLWFDEGEVVLLVTTDAKGNHYETDLWIVDLEGVSFLRAESPSSYWLGRIREFPDVELDRYGRPTNYRAIPIDDEKVRETVSLAMAEKYGNFDQVLQWFRDHSRSVPVQLTLSSGRNAARPSGPRVGVSP